MAAADASIPCAPSNLLEPTDFEVVPAAHELHTSQKEEKKSAMDMQTEAIPTPATAGPAQLSTQNKPEDLFAPREDGGSLATHGFASHHKSTLFPTGFSLIGHLDLDSELDPEFNMDVHRDEPAFPTAAAPAPVATCSRSVLSVAVLTMQHNALNSSLPLFFPQKGMVKFAPRWEMRRGSVLAWRRRVVS
jgi:hypothetical protein